MEQNRKTQQKRKKGKGRIVLVIVLLAVAAVGIYLVVSTLGAAKEAPVSVMRYRTVQVSEGEINSTVSGSGTLTAKQTKTATAPADVRVETVNYQAGDRVKKGDVIATLSSDTVKAELTSLYSELQTAQNRLAGTTKARSNRNITAPQKGIVKSVQVAVGDASENVSYLCKIATDGLMQVTVATDALELYESVTVQIGETALEGTVAKLENGEARITVEDDGYSVGTAAEVYNAAGESIGSGTLDVNDHVLVLCEAGCIEEVRVAENQKVNKNAVLFVLQKGAPSTTYQSRLATVNELEKEIETLEDSLTVTADFDALVAAVYVQAGDELAAGTSICLLTSTEGYTLSLGIDELDVSTVQLGQSVTLTLDAIEGEFRGTVTDLSYDGSGSYVTTYTATVTSEPIDGVFPGMSASAAIVTETSGKTLIVPVSAVQYGTEGAYLYLAGAGEVESLEGLDRIEIETGMSDGSYIAVSGEGLQAGDRIVVPTLTTTAVFEEEETETGGFGGMGNMGGGMPSFGGGQMPDFGGGNMPNYGSGSGMPNMGGSGMRGGRGN